MEVMFLYFPQTGKMLTPKDCDKLHVYNAIPRTTFKISIQKDTL